MLNQLVLLYPNFFKFKHDQSHHHLGNPGGREPHLRCQADHRRPSPTPPTRPTVPCIGPGGWKSSPPAWLYSKLQIDLTTKVLLIGTLRLAI